MDTANTQEIEECVSSGMVDGVTTKPYKVLVKLFEHPLTDSGLQAFLKAWKDVQGR